MDKQTLHGVVFDMDGVIVDSHPAHRFAWREFLRSIGKSVSDSELDFIVDGRKREDILIHFLGPLDETQLVAYGKMKNDLFWRAAAEVVPIPGVLEFIEDVNRTGVPMAVATSASPSRTQSTLTRMALLSCFRAVVTGDEVSKGKPDPAIYRLACQRIDCPPNGAIALEDAASGVRAAKSAGLRCVAIAGSQSRDSLTAAGADLVLQDFVDVNLQKIHALVGMQPERAYYHRI